MKFNKVIDFLDMLDIKIVESTYDIKTIESIYMFYRTNSDELKCLDIKVE